ncbi:LCP family protein [Mediterraneibacter glycyrrhizinilyticus]|nr:LCP family protein [Mediterraneibacter glycyrrhizinilyticus]
MSKNVRRRGRRRRRTRRGNWFTRMKVWQKVLVCTAGVLICLVGSAAIYVAAQWSRIDRQEVRADDLVINQEVMEKNANIDLGEGYTNIALFGVDSRDGNLGEGNRTDMIIVASLNNETKEIRLVSVYRDTLLNLSEGTYQKCNAAYSYGGPTMAINMLNMNLDLDIEDYVTVDFGAISDMIDQLGGVEITIEEEELEAFNKYVTETARVAGKEAHKIDEPGTYLMDGSQATTYARIRSTAGGDFTRTERQRIVIEKAVEKIQKADLLTINNIISEVFPQISTSFTLQEILYYAQAYSQYKLLENTGFPFDQTTDTISGLGSIVIPQNLTDNVSQLHEFLFGDTDYTPSDTVSTISSTILATVDYSGSYDYSYSDYDDGSYSYDDGYEDSGGSGYDDTDDTSGTESSAEEY